MKQKASLAFFLVWLSAASSNLLEGFTSCPMFVDPNGIFRIKCETGHLLITLDITSSPFVTLSSSARQRVAEANIGVDIRETDLYRYRRGFLVPDRQFYRRIHHFDRPLEIKDVDAFLDASKYVADEEIKIINLINSGDCQDASSALDELGAALHAIQDAFSHSNFVDGLSPDERDQFRAALWHPGNTIPAGLHLTEYDPRGSNPEQPDRSDAWSHLEKSKDYIGKNTTDLNLYNLAVSAAQTASGDFVSDIKSAVGDSAWNRFVTAASGSEDTASFQTSFRRAQDSLVPSNASGSCRINSCKACTPISHITEIITSNDPNDKNGSLGVGDRHYLAGLEPLRYSIYYDNTKDAAPAQDVVVNDHLDESIDLNTISLGPITFVNTIITPPNTPLATLKSFSKDVDLRPSQDLIARVTVSLDTGSGVLSWHFQSLDSQSGQPTDDPLAGFLPAGADGSVLFTARSRAALPSNTDVSNTATVIFDGKPLPTPTWSNRLDNTPPKSSVAALPVSQANTTFSVNWNGSDEESGLRDFTVYVSDNGGVFSPWLTNTDSTQASYTGTPGHTYRFYSIARDLVGNMEIAKTVAEATTFVSGGVPGDVNGDGIVDCVDISVVKTAFGSKTGDPGFHTSADVNNDGVIDVRDLAFVSQHLAPGTKCQ